ncbi:MAG: serine/threonine protein kinase [Candidatus Dadabacteria bacterium]|nr:MAG: serine/threonine protein kinase [Candidatus Dadabacteria bacterium]
MKDSTQEISSNNQKNLKSPPYSKFLSSRFEYIKTLGKGAAAHVYLVKDTERMGEKVALKVLTNKKAFDEHTVERFRREFNVSKTISHPNIVKAYDFIPFDDTIAYTMEWVDGESLAALFKKITFSIEEVEVIALQILEGLSALHKRGITHRDIKLENILLNKDGQVKISDLGLVKSLDAKKLTKTGIMLGTAHYFPPEYIKKSIYDERGDLYATGIVLYELLTGKRRLEGKAGPQALEHLIKHGFDLPKISLSGLPRKYIKVILKATEPNLKARYQSAEEFIADIKEEKKEKRENPTLTAKAIPQVKGKVSLKARLKYWLLTKKSFFSFLWIGCAVLFSLCYLILSN